MLCHVKANRNTTDTGELSTFGFDYKSRDPLQGDTHRCIDRSSQLGNK